MKLLNAKIIRGGIAGTRMEWLCGEFENPPFDGEKALYIGCFDITNESHARSIFFINKGQPPERFDFQKDAYSSFEQIAMAQLVVMEWEKLKSGDKITLDAEMEKNIRDWDGQIWMGGSIAHVKSPEPGISIIEKENIPLSKRVIENRIIRYKKKNSEY